MTRSTARPTGRAGQRSRGRRGAQPAPLTREAIVDATLELAEQEGVAALSLRKLGERLGVDATAFYRHFRDKDDIVLAAFDRIISSQTAQLPKLRNRSWRAKLRGLAENTWTTARQHPAMFALAFARMTGGAGERDIVEFILSTLASTGLPPDQVVLYYRMYADAQLALCGMTATFGSLDDSLREKDASAWSRIYAVLPEAEYPAARAHAVELAAADEQTIFLGVIDSILDTVETAITALRG